MMNTNNTNQGIEKKLIGYAKYDVRKVRKLSAMAITGTKQGCVELAYDVNSNTYSIVSMDGGKYRVSGTAKEIAEILSGLYTVVLA